MNHQEDRYDASSAMSEGWSEGGAFLGSVLAGTLIGALLDRWLGTDPWLIVVLTLVGAYSGFMRLWTISKRAEAKYGRGR